MRCSRLRSSSSRARRGGLGGPGAPGGPTVLPEVGPKYREPLLEGGNLGEYFVSEGDLVARRPKVRDPRPCLVADFNMNIEPYPGASNAKRFLSRGAQAELHSELRPREGGIQLEFWETKGKKAVQSIVQLVVQSIVLVSIYAPDAGIHLGGDVAFASLHGYVWEH